MLRRLVRVLMSCALLAGAACVGDGRDDTTRSLAVFAAASLSESFASLADAFEDEYPDVSVTVNVAASSDLATQILEGAPADVYASADEPNMQRVVAAGGTDGAPVVFATNRLQIIVEPGNPLGIETLDDLADPELLFLTTAPQVPIGRYSAEVFEAAGLQVTPRSLEESVRGVVNKVVLGEADAGIVYATDVQAAGESATGIDIPDEFNVVARYPIAVTADSANPDAARAFLDFVISGAGRSILADFGFGSP